jgi:peroxiredoxin
VLLGITFSPKDDLKSWAEEVGLDCHLLCDVSRAVAIAYGAAESADQERPKRMSVLIGPDGRVVRAYATPEAAGHPAEVLVDLG